MSVTPQKYQTLNEQGLGACSVPMWVGGIPAGFCDKPAYGVPPPSRRFRPDDGGRAYREDGRYDGFVPALACTDHGGPHSRVFLDGNAWCAVFPDFTNLKESESGWGDTPEAARKDLRAQTGKESG